MKPVEAIKISPRLQIQNTGEDGFNGYIHHPLLKRPMVFQTSCGGGWEHVSVSFTNRCPTWDEMCMVKDIFWDGDETVIQYHPSKENHVNYHPHCLHLWKPIGIDFPVQPSIFVGPNKGGDKP